jgi:hypothetical protein
MYRTWGGLKQFYAEPAKFLPELEAMASLVEQINSSRYAEGVWGWQSIHDLCIAQMPTGKPYSGPYLRIRPLFDGNVEFRYFDTMVEEKQWHRTVPAREAFSRLEIFFDQLHWFARTG